MAKALDTATANEMDHSKSKDKEQRILGTLYGNCIGDAIGLLTEFMVKEEAKTYYNEHLKTGLEFSQKVPDFHRSRWKNGDWTDDSDQMILIMDSLLELKEINAVDYGQRLRHWAKHGYKELGDFAGMGIGATTHHVLQHKAYKMNPHHAAADVWEQTGRFVAPNGAVMRTSILGIYQSHDIDSVVKNTLEICKVTHADPRCQASCIAVTVAIATMLNPTDHFLNSDGSFNIEKIIKHSYECACKVFVEDYKKCCKELKKYTIDANKLKSLKLDEHGKIGYTYKTLGAGFWALKQTDFRSALTDITMEAGDADTNGAVAGALLGCKLGIQGLPETWLSGLRYKQWLDNRIVKFLNLAFPDMKLELVKEGPFTLAVEDTYPSGYRPPPEDVSSSKQEEASNDGEEVKDEKSDNGKNNRKQDDDNAEKKETDNMENTNE